MECRCEKCNRTFYVFKDIHSNLCPIHYIPDTEDYNKLHWNKLYNLRQEYIGKVIRTADYNAIILDLLSLNTVELVLIPQHIMCIATLSEVDKLLEVYSVKEYTQTKSRIISIESRV
jgi:hypothetical protein